MASPVRFLFVLVSSLLALHAVAEEATTAGQVTAYPQSFFANARASSAYEMVLLLPGFQFSEGDADVRGFAAAGGNVLIDGVRPATKQETLETILRRIPGSAVERVELIRAGAAGVDARQFTLLANVVREQVASTRGSVEVGSGFYQRGFTSPRVSAELSHPWGERSVELSAARYDTVDDEHGKGTRPRVAANGSVLRDNHYLQDEGAKLTELAAGYRDRGLRLNAAFRIEDFRADIREDAFLPQVATETVVELMKEKDLELGAHYERAFGDGMQLEVVGIQRIDDDSGGEHEVEGGSEALSLTRVRATESIVRTTLRRTFDRASVEVGVEGARNVLDSHARLSENGFEVPLPSEDVRVTEMRGEPFARITWNPGPRWTLEGGSSIEVSRLSQRGDSDVSKDFVFFKPRAQLLWSPSARDQLRLLLERRVGQLDFEDFTSSASLSTNSVTAGNPDLTPEQTWCAELAWERHFADNGALVLIARRMTIRDLVDRVPVYSDGGVFDGVGNIGDGTRTEIEAGFDLPLARIGLSGATLRAEGTWRSSRATDPTTGARRPVSEEIPTQATIRFMHGIQLWKGRWELALRSANAEREYRVDEVRTDRFGTTLDFLFEVEPVSGWNLRFEARNLTDRVAERTRQVYDGPRDAGALAFTETRSLRIGPYLAVTVRHEL